MNHGMPVSVTAAKLAHLPTVSFTTALFTSYKGPALKDVLSLIVPGDYKAVEAKGKGGPDSAGVTLGQSLLDLPETVVLLVPLRHGWVLVGNALPLKDRGRIFPVESLDILSPAFPSFKPDVTLPAHGFLRLESGGAFTDISFEAIAGGMPLLLPTPRGQGKGIPLLRFFDIQGRGHPEHILCVGEATEALEFHGKEMDDLTLAFNTGGDLVLARISGKGVHEGAGTGQGRGRRKKKARGSDAVTLKGKDMLIKNLALIRLVR